MSSTYRSRQYPRVRSPPSSGQSPLHVEHPLGIPRCVSLPLLSPSNPLRWASMGIPSSPKPQQPVFRVLRPLVPLVETGWHPYTFESVKRGVGHLVARCERMRNRLKDWVRTGQRNQPQPTCHFFARFFGQPSRSILQRDKGGWSLCALPPGNTAPQRGSGLRRRWSVSGLFAVGGGRKSQKSKDMPTVGRFRRWPLWVVYQNSGGKNVPKYKHSC